MILEPMAIEQRSMEIIESELQVELPDEIKPIIKRVIHTTADFSFAESLHFTQGVVPKIRQMMSAGLTIVTDTNMALAGINKAAANRLNIRLICEMNDPQVALEAKERGCTRATLCAEHALSLSGNVLFVCGNAPTALLAILDTLRGSVPERLAVIGVPVGFVNVVEAKQMLWDSGISCITALGRRGGSNVAASIVNALMYGVDGARV